MQRIDIQPDNVSRGMSGGERKASAMPRLSARLSVVAAAVPPCSTLIDIGTDHAFVPIWCLLSGVCETAVASDIRQGPLDAAKRNALRYNVSDRISFIREDGLGAIPAGRNDCIVIAGMGGFEIISILTRPPVQAGALILQPQKSVFELRHFLAANGYTVLREWPVCDRGKYYVVMEAVYTGVVGYPSLSELYIGQETLRCALAGFTGCKDADTVRGYLADLKRKAEKERRRIPHVEEIYELLQVLTGGQ